MPSECEVNHESPLEMASGSERRRVMRGATWKLDRFKRYMADWMGVAPEAIEFFAPDDGDGKDWRPTRVRTPTALRSDGAIVSAETETPNRAERPPNPTCYTAGFLAHLVALIGDEFAHIDSLIRRRHSA
jgi:hypothetical protein